LPFFLWQVTAYIGRKARILAVCGVMHSSIHHKHPLTTLDLRISSRFFSSSSSSAVFNKLNLSPNYRDKWGESCIYAVTENEWVNLQWEESYAVTEISHHFDHGKLVVKIARPRPW
jgi:hypothetical protein